MDVTVIGSGYVGLVTGACLSELGHNVTCLDRQPKLVKSLREGNVHFYEPFLEELLKNNLKNQRISFTSSYKIALKNSIIFLCIDTPRSRSGRPNLKNFWSSIESIIRNLSNHSTIIIKSTVPIGTNTKLKKYFIKNKILKKKKLKINFCSNPEFLKEGSAVNDFMRPDRIIIGSSNPEVQKLMIDLYKPLNRKSNKNIFMDPVSAELTKYASNTFLATKISFMNEIARISDRYGANIHSVRDGMGKDDRIGNQFLYSGLGFGGSCFPKDLQAMIYESKLSGVSGSIISSAYEVNKTQVDYFAKKIENFYTKNKLDPKKSRLTLWGMSFKPNTDDLRESQSIKLLFRLSKKFERLYVFDPLISKKRFNELQVPNNINYINNQYEKINDSDALAICTEWKQFWNPDFLKLKSLKHKVIFDGRNILDKKLIIDQGLNYIGIGI